MTSTPTFTFSDLVSGYITSYDDATKTFGLRTSDDREFTVLLAANVFAETVRNLGEKFHDASDSITTKLTKDRYVSVYGVFYPDEAGTTTGSIRIEAKHLVFMGEGSQDYRFEEPTWWTNQIRELADFYLQHEFGDEDEKLDIDYNNYRTNLNISGDKSDSGRQETDTISRLVYGFASAFLLTGDDRYLEAAEKGTDYLRDELKYDGADTTFWYHATDIDEDGTHNKIFASEFGDDYNAIPCYEQIYALAGPVQTFRITGDPKILADANDTITTFDTHFKDQTGQEGYFSHVDPKTLSPDDEILGNNQSRKNWNSVGDHAPAYLINLFLATDQESYADFLEYNFDLITEHFGDYENSPFVQERFFADWSKDQSWGWQQNRAVVGHNLKIAWNLMRMNSLRQKDDYEEMAEKIAALMPAAGSDQQRGGWYDVVERELADGEAFHRFAWHDRKAWWQQEQAILAYLILAGITGDDTYRRLARESAAFYNAWFLDTDAGGVYFNVLANGQPYALGTERGKGSHSMAGYHSFELAYLASVYTNLLITGESMDFYFRPKTADQPLRVSPDILPAGSVRIGKAWIDGEPHNDFDADALVVQVPADAAGKKIQVRLVPTVQAEK